MENIALTEAVFYILLSLNEPLHGYGIMQNAEKLSHGRVKLAAGTLYGAINTREVTCHPVNNWRGKQSSIPPHKTRDRKSTRLNSSHTS